MNVGNPRSITNLSGGGSGDLYVLGGHNPGYAVVWQSSDGVSFSTNVSNGFGDTK